MEKLDKKDFALLEALQKDASMRLEELSDLIDLAPSSVHERLRRLERLKIIKGRTIKVNTAALGLGVVAFIGISATKPCSAILPAIEGVAAIEECHSVAGSLSMMVKVRVRDTAALLALTERLRKIPGVDGTETTIVLQTHLERPTALLR